MSAKRGVPGWVWLLAAAPVAFIGLGMVVALVSYGVRRYIADAKQAEALAAASAAPRSASPSLHPDLTGEVADLSSVMGRARKLANGWQPEASLLGIEATLRDGKLRTSEGGRATLTFGPSPFAAAPTTGGLFVVVYDEGGLRGAPATGSPSKALPEPMCAPERVLSRITDLGDGPLLLRYALDASQRPMWLVSPTGAPERQRLFDPQDCQLHGIVAGRNQH
ncbi:MAG: hypothetical protein ABUL60_29130 [Myxococcales bacterium]